jgi:hypothetical protein
MRASPHFMCSEPTEKELTMNRKQLALLTLALAGLGTAGLAQARDRDVDVQWSVTIGSPGGYGPIYAPAQVVVAPQPVYVQRPVVRAYPAPVYVPAPVYRTHPGYRHAGWGDADRDGIPNRYDRVYNPRWDRDGDRIPNRHDRHPNRPGW